MKKIRIISLGKRNFPFFTLCVSCTLKSYSQCGFDLYIANDQSGSVDAQENLQSRQFIEKLALSFTLGNSNTQSRIAIASWSYTNQFEQYNFPSAGAGYTIAPADIVTYRNSPRLYSGNTDPYNALLRAWQNIDLTPVPGRNVTRVIVLMTDAYAYQVNPSIVSLASQVKAAGIRIVVVGIDQAAGNPPQNILQAVASPGMNFSAASYTELLQNALATIQAINTAVCPGLPPAFDLTVTTNSFNCNTGTVNYTVANEGNASFGPATLSVSFYNGNPTSSSAFLLATHIQTGVVLAAGSSASYIYTNASMTGVSNLYAVVNLNTAGAMHSRHYLLTLRQEYW